MACPLTLLTQDTAGSFAFLGWDRYLASHRGGPVRQRPRTSERAMQGQTHESPTTRQARLETLLGITRELSLIQPLESLLAKIAEACGQLLYSDSVGIRVREGQDLVLAGAYGDAREAMPTPRLKVGESLSGIVAATGKPLLVGDAAADDRMTSASREAYRRGGYTAFLGVPLILGEQVLGVLSIRSRRALGFSSEDLAVATAFAAQPAVPLENSRLYHETQWAYQALSETQDQLTQARKLAAVRRLAGCVAHDFNTPLTVMIRLLPLPFPPPPPPH